MDEKEKYARQDKAGFLTNDAAAAKEKLEAMEAEYIKSRPDDWNGRSCARMYSTMVGPMFAEMPRLHQEMLAAKAQNSSGDLFVGAARGLGMAYGSVIVETISNSIHPFAWDMVAREVADAMSAAFYRQMRMAFKLKAGLPLSPQDINPDEFNTVGTA